jgi:ankyrin repeat protein
VQLRYLGKILQDEETFVDAVAVGDLPIVTEKLKYGTDKDVMTENGFAALHLAARANTEAKTKKDRTALHLAAENVHGKVVRVLLDGGASNEGRDSSRWIGVRWAVEKDKAELLKLIE